MGICIILVDTGNMGPAENNDEKFLVLLTDNAAYTTIYVESWGTLKRVFL